MEEPAQKKILLQLMLFLTNEGVSELICMMSPLGDVQVQAFIEKAPGCGAITGRLGEQTSAWFLVSTQFTVSNKY